MTEKTIPLPLSGEEIKVAICDKVRQVLDGDCFLNESTAYDWFDGKVTIELCCNDMGREERVKRTVTATSGDKPMDHPLNVNKVELDLKKAPPNAVRIETGQGVPTESGNRIKYARTVAEKAKA